jgi:hypothetical protein
MCYNGNGPISSLREVTTSTTSEVALWLVTLHKHHKIRLSNMKEFRGTGGRIILVFGYKVQSELYFNSSSII